MPRGDRTGPNGAGPRSGRGLGFCNGNNVAGFQNNGFGHGGFGAGRGFGRGFGRGMGRGFGGYYENETVSEVNSLKKEIAELKESLKSFLNKDKTEE